MSYENYKKAMELAKTLPNYKIYDCCSNNAMDELEDYLGFELSKQHYDFLRQGALEVSGRIFCANFKDAHYTSMDVIANLEMNKKYNLTVEDKFVPILEEDEWINYLNYNRLTKDGEPTVVYAWPTPDEFIIFEQTDQDLGDFLFELFQEIKTNLESEDDY